jgi:RNA polymerase sigma-70 factor (ECF subfamily)
VNEQRGDHDGTALAARPASDAAPESPGQGIDLALVEEALKGRLEAFNELVTRHQDHLFALVYRLVPDRDQAADVVQEAFFSAYRNLASFRGGSVRSWLGKIAVNAAMDLQRARKRRPIQPYPEFEDDSWQPPAESEAEPEMKALAIERSKALAAALATLTADQRTCIVLFDVEGYDYSEIATIMKVEVGTVKSRIHRGRLALRGVLAPHRELFRG